MLGFAPNQDPAPPGAGFFVDRGGGAPDHGVFPMEIAMIRLAALFIALPAAAMAQELPLARGFYVDAGVGCAGASNATLALLKKDGLNSSRTDCAFTGLTDRGDGTIAFTEHCSEIGTDSSYDSEGMLEILGPDRFRLFGEGWETTFQHCPQDSLPEPWRNNDIADLID